MSQTCFLILEELHTFLLVNKTFHLLWSTMLNFLTFFLSKKQAIPSLKLTARTWNTGVCSDEFLFGSRPPARCELFVLGSVLFMYITPWKFNIDPQILPSQRESSLPTIIFQRLCNFFWKVASIFERIFNQQQPAVARYHIKALPNDLEASAGCIVRSNNSEDVRNPGGH